MQLTDQIYSFMWHGVWENNANMYYFGAPFNMLFDPGMRYLFEVQTKKLAESGIKLEDIHYVISTHCHPDHIEACADLMNNDIKIGAHINEIDFYRNKREEMSKILKMELPEISFNMNIEESSFTVDGAELQFIHTPGHTPGSLCVFWPEKKTLVCGDMLFDHSFGKRNLPGTDYTQLYESINKILKLDVEYLLPGHMAVIIGKSNVKTRLEQTAEAFAMYI